MAKITGIGGIFLRTKSDTTKLLHWYRDVLGLDITEYGINFLTPNQFTLITYDNKDEQPMLNFSVDDLETFVTELKEKNVTIQQEIIEYDFGKFAQIKDPFGTVIELAEIIADNYLQMVKKEIADYNEES